MPIPTFTSTLDDQDLGVAIVQNGKDIFFPEHEVEQEMKAMTLADINAQVAASLGANESIVFEVSQDPPEKDLTFEAFLAEKNTPRDSNS